MAYSNPLWLENGSTSAVQDRSLLWVAADQPGVTSSAGLKVSQRAAGANMSVDVATGTAVMPSAQGPYYVGSSDSVVNLAIGAAPAVGNERRDLVVATVRDAFTDGGSFNDWYLQVVPGVPAANGTAVVPPTPAASLALASVLVGGGVTSITGFAIPDLRVPCRRIGAYSWGGTMPAQYATGSFAQWGLVTFNAPQFPVSVVASMYGQFAPASNSSVLCGWRLDISFDGGTNWTLGTEIQGLSQGTLNPAQVANGAVASGTTTNAGIYVRAMIRQVSPGNYSQFQAGTMTAIVTGQ